MQALGNLTLIYDDNQISIEDDTNIALIEDVAARYEAYGWHVQTVDWTNGGRSYKEDVRALYDAIRAAERVTDRPSFIRLQDDHRVAGAQQAGHGTSHGSALGEEEVAATKKILGFDPEQTFEVPARRHRAHPQAARAGRRATARRGTRQYAGLGASATAVTRQLLHRMKERAAARGLGRRPARPSPPTRRASPPARRPGAVIQAIAKTVPELWGGSADLAESNNTTIEGAPSFLPHDRATKMWKADPTRRPGAALRHPRARHGLDHERHRRPRRHPRLRRHLPHLLRLHARRRSGSRR